MVWLQFKLKIHFLKVWLEMDLLPWLISETPIANCYDTAYINKYISMATEQTPSADEDWVMWWKAMEKGSGLKIVIILNLHSYSHSGDGNTTTYKPTYGSIRITFFMMRQKSLFV